MGKFDYLLFDKISERLANNTLDRSLVADMIVDKFSKGPEAGRDALVLAHILNESITGKKARKGDVGKSYGKIVREVQGKVDVEPFNKGVTDYRENMDKHPYGPPKKVIIKRVIVKRPAVKR